VETSTTGGESFPLYFEFLGWILPPFPGGILHLSIHNTLLFKAFRATKVFKAVIELKSSSVNGSSIGVFSYFKSLSLLLFY